jgi:hypothetical protein
MELDMNMRKFCSARHPYQTELLTPRNATPQLDGNRTFAKMPILAFPTAGVFDYYFVAVRLAPNRLAHLCI